MRTDLSPASSGTDDDVGSEAAERFAAEHPGLVRFGRIGWIAKGVVYTLTGVLALVIALDSAGSDSSGSQSGGGAGEASQTGAITAIAESTGGAILLWVIAAGLVVYSLWRLVSVVLPADNSATAWAKRIGYAVSAVVYLLLAGTAVAIARSPGSGSQQGSEDNRIETFTRDLMESTGGRFLVGAIGVALIAVAGVFLWNAVTASFESELIHRGVGPLSYRHLVTLGRIGWVGRSVMMALIGWFLLRAAIDFDPEEAGGLDDSLRQAAGSGVGTALVFVVALGLLAFGAFCLLSAPRQRLVGADS
jgi:hypothetical protein